MNTPEYTEQRVLASYNATRDGLLSALRRGGCAEDRLDGEFYRIVLLLAVAAITDQGRRTKAERELVTVDFVADLFRAINGLAAMNQQNPQALTGNINPNPTR